MARTAAVCLFTAHFLCCIIVCRQDSGNNRPRDQSTVSESSRRFRTEFLEDWPQTPGAPYFDPSTPDNVTGLVGHPVTLLCKVKNLQNRTVSWVRHRDIHLLTVGRYTYTSDQRFEAQHKPRSEEWALRIRSPQRRDSGQYECQISTTPPIGHAVHLNIVEPETEIMGGPDLFIYAGSTINLTCIVRHTPEPPNTINWTHRGKTDFGHGGQSHRRLANYAGDIIEHKCVRKLVHSLFFTLIARWDFNPTRPERDQAQDQQLYVLSEARQTINFDSTRGGISLVTEKGLHSSSRLLVQSARTSDAGTYQCAPDNAQSATARVHVLTGETPAAMQGSAQWASSFDLHTLIGIASVIYLLIV